MVADPPELIGVVLVDGDPGIKSINGLSVLGPIEAIGAVCSAAGVAQGIVSLPAAYRDQWRSISTELRMSGVIERFVTPMDELLNSAPAVGEQASVQLSNTKIDLGKLVGRQAHSIDRELVGENSTDKCVLVTGAGGSIGSELVKQIASFGPRRIVLMERSENALFGVDRWLKEIHPEIERVAILHDVVDAPRTLALLERHRPEVVFHAAAHKHVPLMEDHPAHAVTNNVFGTKSIADAAVASGARRFVLISTDKAVNPVNVMGATKRIAEMYTQSLAARPGVETKLSMVRFGNVLGSACSVLEIWSSQISEGQPITVTDERMTRYFMTIPEAATLVLQAGAMSGSGIDGRSGEVFVLDMGQPINIFTLAQRFIRACGCEPVIGQPAGSVGPDRVPVILTGARPGEKLHEQLSYDAEALGATAHPGIACFAHSDLSFINEMDALIETLDGARRSSARQDVVRAIASAVPTMDSERIGSAASRVSVA